MVELTRLRGAFGPPQPASVWRCRESRPGPGDPDSASAVYHAERRKRCAPAPRAGPAGASWASDSAVLQPSDAHRSAPHGQVHAPPPHEGAGGEGTR